MGRIEVSENTVIGEAAISLDRYRSFLRKEIEGFAPDAFCGEFRYWLDSYEGRTLKEVIEDYFMMAEQKNLGERLAEKRFNIISKADKDFIFAFSKSIGELGYDFGGIIGSGFCWGKYMIIYSKVGVKSKQVAARIFVRDGHIVLRLFFNNVDKHRQYIESSPEHIKNVFTDTQGDCSCNPKKENCRMRKTYTVDGKLIEKCSGVVFEFYQPNLDKMPDYVELLREFYSKKKF